MRSSVAPIGPFGESIKARVRNEKRLAVGGPINCERIWPPLHLNSALDLPRNRSQFDAAVRIISSHRNARPIGGHCPVNRVPNDFKKVMACGGKRIKAGENYSLPSELDSDITHGARER
jgi:hypothetical protein